MEFQEEHYRNTKYFIILIRKHSILTIFLFLLNTSVWSQITVTNDGEAITIENGVTLTIQGSFVNQTNGTDGSIDNDGVITASVSWTNNAGNNVFSTNAGRVEFINTTNNDSIKGSNPTHFHDLTLNNSTGNIEAFLIEVNNTTVRGALTMTAGSVNLNSNKLIIGTSAASTGSLVHSETSSSGVLYDGSLERYIASGVLASGDLKGFFPMGTSFLKYRPFYLSAAATGPTTGGSYTIFHNEAPDHTPTTPVTVADDVNIEIRHNARWTGTASGIVGGTYQLNAGGTGYGTIANINDARLMLASSVVGNPGANSGTPANILVQRTNLSLAELGNTFYIGSIDSTNSPLPVELVHFSVSRNELGEIELNWSTLSEINNESFIVERSLDGENYDFVLEVAGAGNSYSVLNYSGIDYTEISNNKIYYRLKQIDFDGSITYSHVEVIQDNKTEDFTVYPIPSYNQDIQISTTNTMQNSDEPTHIMVINELGQMVYQTQLLIRGTIPASSFPASGIYFIRAKTENKMEQISKIIFYK